MKKVLIGVGILIVVGGLGYANFRYRRADGVVVTTEKVEARDLQAIVSASGSIQPERSVDISADTMGRVVNLAVDEGDIVKKNQFLLQIDPHDLQAQVQNQEASLAGAKSSLEETRRQIESAKASLAQSQQALARQEMLMKQGLTTRETYDNAVSDLQMKKAAEDLAEQSLNTQQTRIKQQEAQLETANYDLTKVRIVSPIDGIITKRNIQEGETVVVGTMNNAGTVLLSVADMAKIQAEINVDETDIPSIKLGQPAKISIDAIPDKTFDGTVTQVGNSPIDSTGTTTTSSSSTRATNFKVVVKIAGPIPSVRPGFSCTANITTATRSKVISVPIQALTVRELVVDQSGKIVPQPVAKSHEPAAAPPPLTPGESRKEFDGVFLMVNGKAAFTPVKTGIAGDKYFEVLDGLKPGDAVITGPFASVRGIKDGDAVRVDTSTPAR